MSVETKIDLDEKIITGIEQIDSEHLRMFNLIRDFKASKHSREKVFDFLLDMNTYIMNHFQVEEKYMKKLDYKGFEAHKALHDEFVGEYKKMLLLFAESADYRSVLDSIYKLFDSCSYGCFFDANVEFAQFLKRRFANISSG